MNENRKKINYTKFIIYSSILFIVTFLLNVNTLSNKFVFDDEGLIQKNRFIIEGTTIKEIFSTNYRYGANNPDDGLYRPLVMLSFVLNAKKLNPQPFHFFNIVLNALNSSLLFLLIFFLTGNYVIGFFTALFFSFHPIHTEAVANISGRPELMCALFLFLSWISLEKPGKCFLSNIIGSILLFLALLSKETAVMFPFMVIACDVALHRRLHDKYMIQKYIFLIITVIFYIIIRWLVLGDTMTGNVPKFYNNPIAFSPFQERIGTAMVVLLRYMVLLLFPLKLSSDYSYNTLPIYDSFWHFIPLTAFFLCIISFSLAFYFRKRNPLYLLALIFFFIPYSIVSNIFFPIGTIMGERLMYLPSAGFALMLGLFSKYLFDKWRYSVYIITICLLLAYSVQTISRNRDWYDDYTLTKADLKTSQSSVKLLYNMGYQTAIKGQYQISEKYFRKSLEIYPDFVESITGIGKLLYNQKEYDESLSYYARAKKVEPDNPQIIFDYTAVLIKMGQFDKAELELQNSIKQIPYSPLLFRGMGNLMYSRENYETSISNYEKALQLGGNKLILINNIAGAYYSTGKIESAYKYIRMAESLGIQLNPELLRTIKTAYDIH